MDQTLHKAIVLQEWNPTSVKIITSDKQRQVNLFNWSTSLNVAKQDVKIIEDLCREQF